MQWSEFQPYVLPYVIGCPDPLLEHHARLATIEFCRRTLCLTKTLPAVLADGTTNTVNLTPGTGRQVIKVKAVEVDGYSWPVISTFHGQDLARADSTADFAYMTDPDTLAVHPLQAENAPVVVDAAIAPTMASTDCPDELLPYMQDIAMGVIASLQLVPNHAFTNSQHASVSQSGFNARVSTIAAKMARGQAAAKMRSKTTYI